MFDRGGIRGDQFNGSQRMQAVTPAHEGYLAATRRRTGGMSAQEPLRECVRQAVESYFSHLDGHGTTGLYRLVLAEVEAPLLETVLIHARGNHSRAAEMLGINRGTLRKKLKQYGLA